MLELTRIQTALPPAGRFSRLALLITAASSALCWLMHPWFQLANLSMIYLLAVAYAAAVLGRTEAVLTSVLGVAAFDIFFVPPRGSFTVADAQYLLTFAVMLFIGLLISALTLQA